MACSISERPNNPEIGQVRGVESKFLFHAGAGKAEIITTHVVGGIHEPEGPPV